MGQQFHLMQRTPPELTANARSLRNAATEAERKLWHAIRHYRPRFTRQLVISHYIVDIACRSAKVAVELDGSQHLDRCFEDAKRTEYLESRGWVVMRFWNDEVLRNVDGVAALIFAEVEVRIATHPRPLP